MTSEQPTLQKHRDLWTNSFTWWWSLDRRVISPYFESEEEANEWFKSWKESKE